MPGLAALSVFVLATGSPAGAITQGEGGALVLQWNVTLRESPDWRGTIVGRLPRGATVHVEGCDGPGTGGVFCRLREAPGFVDACALGSAAQAALRAAEHHLDLWRELGKLSASGEQAAQRVERLVRAAGPCPGFGWRAALDDDRTRAGRAVRLGVVGLTRTSAPDDALVRDGEEVLALCADGARRLPAGVRLAPRGEDGAVAVALTVDCAADVVIAGLPGPARVPPVATTAAPGVVAATAAGDTVMVGERWVAWTAGGVTLELPLWPPAARYQLTPTRVDLHVGDYDGDGDLDLVATLHVPSPEGTVPALVLVLREGPEAVRASWLELTP